MRALTRRTSMAAALLAATLGAGTSLAQATLPAYDPRTAFTETDKNGDGAVDHEELIDRITEVFFLADVNKDGSLSVTEVDVALVHTENLAAADSNKNGSLNLYEFRRARLDDFENADKDRSGTLSVTEVVEAYAPRGK